MIKRCLLALLAGALYIFAFAPFHYDWLAFLAPALLLYCWKDASPKRAFFYGFLFGLTEFGIGTSWVYVSIHNFGNANTLLAGFITALFTIVLSLYPALQGFFLRKLFAKKPFFIESVIAFPILWVLLEWLRGLLFTGFPWLMLGYTQTSTLLSAYTPIIGIYGITWLTALMSGVILWVLLREKKIATLSALFIPIIIFAIAFALSHHAWTKPTQATPLSVALIQGNAPQTMKWDPDYISQNIQNYLDATQKHIDSSLIVWPEAAIPLLPEQASELLQNLNQFATTNHSAIIFGIPSTSKDGGEYYNSMTVVGKGAGRYNKRHLVPFGEYTPLGFIFNPVMNYFNIPFSDIASGAKNQTPLNAQGIRIAPFICYEIVYPTLALETIRDTQLIIVINDDSWFGHSFASSQQIQMAQVRAKESGRYVLYASNTGITAVINPDGTVQSTAPERVFATLNGEIYPMQGNTPLMHWHYYPLFGILLILLTLGLIIKSRH